MIVRRWWAGTLLVALAGCDAQAYDGGFGCLHPDEAHVGADGMPDPCRLQDVGAGGNAQCAVGEFVHWFYKWEEPSWLWIGPEEQAPECPFGADTIAYEGRTDLVAPTECEACTCDPPTGACALPSTLTASTTACNIPGGSSSSFDAPTPWDGQCDGATQVPTGAAHSLTVGAMAMTETGCTPGSPPPAKVLSLHWNTFARACDIPLPDGPLGRSTCLVDAPPPGFKLCIFQKGEQACPNVDPGNVFTEQHIFYQGVQDARQCSPCTCGSPVGSACTATLSIYKGADLTCGGSTFAQIPISSVSPTCTDIQLPGQALGSKSAGTTTYLPGTCAAMGGEASGSAVKTEPDTLCCRP